MSRPKSPAVTLADLSPRHAEVLSLVWFDDGLSRSDLHVRTGVRLRTVGAVVEDLMRWGLLQEGSPRVAGVGRPQVPLVVRCDGARLVGVSIVPGQVSIAATDVRAETILRAKSARVDNVAELIPAAVNLMKSFIDRKTLSVGVGLSGFVDDASGNWLLSSAHPGQPQISLAPLLRAAKGIPLVVNNELHAMSAAARLQGGLSSGDSLLVHLDEGRVASSILIDGKPNRGSVLAANELGHTTMPVKTKRCYCGQIGCIERIFSSGFLGVQKTSAEFQEQIDRPNPSARVREMIDYTARAIANAINFVRPGVLLIATSMHLTGQFRSTLEAAIKGYTLQILQNRLRISWQQWTPEMSAAAAGALPMSNLLQRRIGL